MFDKEKFKNHPMFKVLESRITHLDEGSKAWQQFRDYVKPFVQNNDEMMKLLHEIDMQYISAIVDDTLLIGAVQAHEMTVMFGELKAGLRTPFCLKCQKKIEAGEDAI